MLLLGTCYCELEDSANALKWWRKSAEQGCETAQSTLATEFYEGNFLAQDYTEAVKWWRKIAEQGEWDVNRALCGLGDCYSEGKGVPQDYAEAVKWYRKAANMGSPWGQYELGNCYYKGKGVPQDYNEAAKWWRKAAEKGEFEAKRALERLGQ